MLYLCGINGEVGERENEESMKEGNCKRTLIVNQED